MPLTWISQPFLFENPHEDWGRRLNFLTRWYNELGPRWKRSYTSPGGSISAPTSENSFFLPILDYILYIVRRSSLPVTFEEIVQFMTTCYPLREQLVEIVQYGSQDRISTKFCRMLQWEEVKYRPSCLPKRRPSSSRFNKVQTFTNSSIWLVYCPISKNHSISCLLSIESCLYRLWNGYAI